MRSHWVWAASVVLSATLLFVPLAIGQAPAPPSGLTAGDHPWDNGTRIDLKWSLSGDDAALLGYIIRKKAAEDKEFARVDSVPAGTAEFTVHDLDHETAYLFTVSAQSKDGAESTPIATTTPITPAMEWFDGTRLWFLVTLILFSGAVIAYILLARRGARFTLRPISGLKAVDEAVGRATEMGRSCLFVPGILDMNDIQTIAAMNILGRVASTAAEYDAKLEVPTSKSLVMTAARETVQSSYLSAGRPDAFNAESIYYVTDEQFGYAAYVQGLMVREKPAACFYMGSFFAESLLFAEMGNGIGAIQIAGTAQPAQLPFFVAACDYTLIGEEFFAASAYLSGEPEQMGSIKGQDVGKVIVVIGIIIGVIAATIVSVTGSSVVRSFLDFLTGTMLT